MKNIIFKKNEFFLACLCCSGGRGSEKRAAQLPLENQRFISSPLIVFFRPLSSFHVVPVDRLNCMAVRARDMLSCPLSHMLPCSLSLFSLLSLSLMLACFFSLLSLLSLSCAYRPSVTS